jgi:hypothetical protein
VLSPIVEQDLKARGVAQVIVVLHQDVGAASADSAAARTLARRGRHPGAAREPLPEHGRLVDGHAARRRSGRPAVGSEA